MHWLLRCLRCWLAWHLPHTNIMMICQTVKCRSHSTTNQFNTTIMTLMPGCSTALQALRRPALIDANQASNQWTCLLLVAIKPPESAVKGVLSPLLLHCMNLCDNSMGFAPSQACCGHDFRLTWLHSQLP